MSMKVHYVEPLPKVFITADHVQPKCNEPGRFWLTVTTDPELVTCKQCLSKMKVNQ